MLNERRLKCPCRSIKVTAPELLWPPGLAEPLRLAERDLPRRVPAHFGALWRRSGNGPLALLPSSSLQGQQPTC